MVGAAPCPLDAGRSTPPTALVCTLGPHVAGPVPVSVRVPGAVGFAAGAFNYTYPLLATSLTPATGSIQGGLEVVLTGAGFLPTSPAPSPGATLRVLVGGYRATVLSATPTSISFLVPASVSAVTSTLVVPVVVRLSIPGVSDNINVTYNGFTYSTALTPVGFGSAGSCV
jgi:hypothetical protein